MVDPTLKKQSVSLDEIASLGYNGVITNAYLAKKSFLGPIKIHSILGFNGVVMTDSGAYQILRYGSIDVTNRDIVKYQCEIESDIGVILDIPTSFDVTYEEALKSAELTLQRALEVADIVEECREVLWVLPIQGGTYTDVLKLYAKKSVEVARHGYSIYALGSPTTLLENYMLDKVVDMVFNVRFYLEPAQPLHLFGAGHPIIIPFVVALGVDLMDSASYILYAKDRRYMTRRGTYRLNDLHYLPCTCPVCSKYSVEDLKSMDDRELERLIALHNLYVLRNEIQEIKESIRECRLWEYLEEKARTHPAARRAFEAVKKYLEYIYNRSPYEKPRGRAVFILSEESVYNPKVMIARRKILALNMQLKRPCVTLSPLSKHGEEVGRCYEKLKSNLTALENCSEFLYHPIIGVVPRALVNMYPFSQFESYYVYSSKAVKDLAYTLVEYLMKLSRDSRHLKAYILISTGIDWQEELQKTLELYTEQLRATGIFINILKC